MQISNFAKRFAEAIEIKNKKPAQIVKQSEILFNDGKITKPLTLAQISHYIKGDYKARQDKVDDIAKILDVSPIWLMGYDVPINENSLEYKLKQLEDYMKENDIETLKLLPIYGTIKAGEPNWAEQNILGYIPFDSSIDGFSNKEDYFYLKVDGESMNQIIKSGDYALIQKTTVATDGDIVVALVNGFDATLKRFRYVDEGKRFISLDPVSNDTSIEPISVDLKTTNFQILGKFVGYFGKYKK